jgi:hypothetical protein
VIGSARGVKSIASAADPVGRHAHAPRTTRSRRPPRDRGEPGTALGASHGRIRARFGRVGEGPALRGSGCRRRSGSQAPGSARCLTQRAQRDARLAARFPDQELDRPSAPAARRGRRRAARSDPAVAFVSVGARRHGVRGGDRRRGVPPAAPRPHPRAGRARRALARLPRCAFLARHPRRGRARRARRARPDLGRAAARRLALEIGLS